MFYTQRCVSRGCPVFSGTLYVYEGRSSPFIGCNNGLIMNKVHSFSPFLLHKGCRHHAHVFSPVHAHVIKKIMTFPRCKLHTPVYAGDINAPRFNPFPARLAMPLCSSVHGKGHRTALTCVTVLQEVENGEERPRGVAVYLSLTFLAGLGMKEKKKSQRRGGGVEGREEKKKEELPVALVLPSLSLPHTFTCTDLKVQFHQGARENIKGEFIGSNMSQETDK